MSVKSNKGKSFLILLIVLLIAICLAIDFWYYWIVKFAPEKTVLNTFNVGELQLTDGTKEDIIKIKYFSNKNQNGLELLDVQLNYFRDETQEGFYTQGIQFVANTENDNLTWDYVPDYLTKKEYYKDGNWFTGYNSYYEIYGTWDIDKNSGSIYNYSANNKEPFGISSNPITKDFFFRINIGDDIYGLKFKNESIGRKVKRGESQYILPGYSIWNAITGKQIGIDEYYYSYDINYFIYKLLSKVKSYPSGTEGKYVFELEDLFEYSKWDGNTYNPVINEDEIVKVNQYTFNYYSISVEVSDDGAQFSTDSLFGIIHNNPNYRASEDIYDDYLYGKEIIEVDNNDFDLVSVEKSNYVLLKLKTSFKNYYSKYKEQIFLLIEIDLDKLNEQGYEFLAFAEDSGLKEFNILECYSVQLKDGEPEKAVIEI